MNRPSPTQARRAGARTFRLQLDSLEDRTVPTVLLEQEPNNSFASPQVVSTIPTGDILTTPANDWLTIQGSIATQLDIDYYRFTLTERAGVFFDIDAAVHTTTSGLQTELHLYNSSQSQIDENAFGYDFDEFAVPETETLGPFIPPQSTGVHFDSSLYRDLQPGTYFITVEAWNFITGNYNLRILADTTYLSSPPVFSSNPGASDTLYLDYDGHSAAAGVERWNNQQPYTALPYDFGNTPGEWSPGERLAIRNTWQVVAEDFAPFNINITTAPAPATMVAGQSSRMVITNSNGSIIGQPSSGLAGIAWLDVYGDDLHEWRTAFVFAGAMPNGLFGGDTSLSGDIVAKAHEIGSTAAHEFGHNLGLNHYQTPGGSPGSVLPHAIMAWSNVGIDKARWSHGTTFSPTTTQDDMAKIAGASNTFGYRTDAHGSTTATATVLSATGNTYTTNGIIERETDADWFKITASGATTVTLNVSEFSGNLDAILRLRDSAGNVVETANPSGVLGATITRNLTGGTYYVEVKGTEDPVYAMVGQYSLRVDTIVLVPPALSGIEAAALAYTENQSLAVTATLAVADPDSANLQGATVTLSAGYTAGQDFLDFTNQNGITGSFSSGTLTLTGSATLAAYQTALRSVQYRNSSENPSTATRTVSFRVTDPDGNTSNFATRNITVTAVNDPPVADNEAYATNEDTQLTVAAGGGVLDGDSDPEASPITAVLVDDVQHGTLSLAANGSFVYTPAANFNGTDTFTYRASDGTLQSNLATVTLIVNAVNDPPVADNDAYATNEDTPLTVAAPGVLDGDTDVEGTTLTAVLVDDVQHGTLSLAANGSFTYTPAANYNGTDTFTYRASDGSATSNLATVTLTINAVNDAPVADNDFDLTLEDLTSVVPVGNGVLVGDTDAEGAALTAALVDNVQHGTLTFNSNGSFTYTPNANYHGTDTFTYRANDGLLDSNLATVTITVDPVNDAPVPDDDAYSTNEDTTLTVTAPGVLEGDIDVDGDSLRPALITNVQHGTLTLNNNGSFTYIPNANFNGTDTFTYKAIDGTIQSDLATVTLTVTAVNDAPVADNDAYSTNEDTQLTVAAATGVLDGDTDVDGQTLTAVLVDDVQHGTLSLAANGSFVYTPAANFNGTDTFTYRASDGSLTSNLATVTLTINAVNDPPVADNDAYATNEDTPLTVAAGDGVLIGDTDVEGTTLTAVLVDTVQHGTLSLAADGSFTYTPAANYNGTDTFTYRASDGSATSNLATVTLTVNAVNDAPVADNDAYATNEDVPLTVASATGVLDGDTDVDLDTLTAALVTDVQHGTLALAANGSFVYTPAANYNGTDTFTYRASDGSLTSNLATVTLTINPVNDAPVADNEAYATDEDAPLTVAVGNGVLIGDTDVEGTTLTAVLVDTVQHGTLSLAADGSFTYTPAANYNGTDTFTYRASDGSLTSNLATVTLTVNPVNDPPVADNDAYATNEDTPLTVASATGVLDGDTDVDLDALTAVLVTDVQHGTLALAANGSFVYTPAANYNGTDTFTYRASDGSLTSNLATVTLTINAVNDPPVADNEAYATDEDAPLTVAVGNGVLIGDTDVEGTALTVVLVDTVQHGTLSLAADGSFTYTPAANYNGTDTFTYRASDGNLTSNLATVTLTINPVNDAPVADNDAYSVDEDGTLTVAAATGVLDGDTDVDLDALTVVLVNDVQHGTLALAANGSFTYTPAANYNGTDTFTYRASDGNLTSNLATVTLTVNPVNDAPVADNDAYATNEDVPLTVAAATGVLDGDTDVDLDALTAVLVNDVQHGTLSLAANGSFTYTPAANFNGTDTFTYRASDGSATSNLATVTLTINAVNDAPVADNDAYSTNEDTPLTVAAAAGVLVGDTDVEGTALTAALVDDVQHGTLALASDGSFTYTPAANFNGTDTFTYRASDGSLTSNLATVTLTINPVNDPPVADNDAYATNEDTQLTVAAATGVLDGDTDVDLDTLTAALVTDVQHGTLALAANGSFVYTPAANYNGTDTFTYRASDGSATSNLATVTLTINPVNDAPVADNDAYATNEDTQLTVAAATGVLDGDTDVDLDALTAVLVDDVQHGTLALAANGSFTYTPAANFNGTDTFTYRASDGSLTSNLATVTLTINAVNDPPVADNDAYSTNEDTALTVAAATGVLDGDTDVDLDALTAVLVNDVQHGTLALAANGSFVYTPAANYNGTDTFTYRASDGTATSNLATVTLTINAVNDPPVADNEAYATDEDTQLTVAAATGVLIGDTDVEGATLTAVLVDTVQHGTLSLAADGSFTYTPAANYNGTDTFTYRASDGSLTSNLATVTLTVNPVNDAPVADNDAYATNEDTQLTVAAATGVLDGDTDVDLDALTAVLVNDVQHGTLALAANGSFVYTPAANYNGTDTFTYRASDGTATSNLATVTLTINAVNDPPVADNEAYSTNEDTPLTVAAGDGVLIGDTDVEGATLTAVLVDTVQHGTLSLAADGSFTYTPAANYNGTDTFTYRASDGSATSNLATVTLTINPVNDAPVADNDAYATNEDTPLTVAAATGVLNGDTDVEGSALTAALIDNVQHGTLALATDGSFVYTPAANYNGTDTFTYRASDGSLTSNLATVTLTINPVNDAPVADNEAYATDEDTPLTVAVGNGVLIGDTDVEGTTLTAVLVDTVQHGTLSLAADGSFTYTPTANYNGTDTFTYRATDGNLTSNLATVTLTINPVNDAPVADNDAYATNEDTPLTVAAATGVLDGDTDVDLDALTAVLVNDVQHGTLALAANGSFVYTPAANYNGTDTFTYRASDGSLTSNLATVTLTINAVNDPPVADNEAYATDEDTQLTVAAAAGVLIGDTDVEGTTLTAVLVDTVQHGSLTLNTDGSFTYTPAANYNGTDTFTYRASDGSATSNLATVTLTIDPVNDAPVADADAYPVNEDGSLSVPAATGVLNGDTDVEGSALTAILVGDVQHGSLTLNTDGSFTYTPAANYNGTDTFTYRASDSSLTSNLATVTLTINAVNDVPVADNDAYATNEDVPIHTPAGTGVLFGDTDIDGETLTAVLVNDVQHGSLTLNTDGSFVYTPAANYNGTDTFTYRASDGTATSNLATVTLTIDPVNDAPVADDETYTVAEGGTLNIAAGSGVLVGDTDVENSTLTAVLVNNVQHGTLNLNTDGSFTYTPTGTYNGPDSFTYQASDGTATSNLATVTITVTPLNFPPVAQPNSYSVAEDGTLSVAAPGVLGNDTDPDGDSLTAVPVSGPTHGNLTLNPNGSFTYTPAGNYNGPDSFTYQASDGSLTSDPVTVSLTVTPVNDTPVAVGESHTTPEDIPLVVGAPGVLGNDTDVDLDSLTAVPVAGPAHGSLTLNPNGSFTYTPATNYNGPDSFTYQASDGTATSAVVTVNLTVTAVNDAPTVGDDSAAVLLKKSVTISVLTNDSDPEGNPFSIQSFTLPTKGTVRRVENTFVYTSTGPLAGADSFTYTVVDSLGATATGTVYLTITDPVAPTLTAVRARYGTAGSADLKNIGRTVLPWASLTRFELGFSEDAIPTAGALTLTGPAGAVPMTLLPVPATGAKSAVWTFAALTPGMYTLRVTGTGVRDINGNPLPGDYVRTFGILPGDFDGNGLVDNRDLNGIKSKYQSNPALVDRFADINGDGVVNVQDYNIAKAALGTRLF